MLSASKKWWRGDRGKGWGKFFRLSKWGDAIAPTFEKSKWIRVLEIRRLKC